MTSEKFDAYKAEFLGKYTIVKNVLSDVREYSENREAFDNLSDNSSDGGDSTSESGSDF